MTATAVIDEALLPSLPRRANKDVILEKLAPDGKRLVDVGSGDGALTRMLTKAGARVTGVECGALPLRKARAAEAAGDEDYVEGVGQNLPFDDGSLDGVVYFNVLHHVPVSDQRDAVAEAARVLRPGGLLYVNEPIAQGSSFEMNRLIEDETVVRQAAFEAMGRSEEVGLRAVEEYLYVVEITHPDFEAYRERSILVDERRAAVFDRNDRDLRAAFASCGVAAGSGRMVEQPMRVSLFERAS